MGKLEIESVWRQILLFDIHENCCAKNALNAGIFDASRVYEYMLSEIQDFLGLHYSTISRIATSVDAARESTGKICPQA